MSEIKNARITRTTLGVEDHGILTAFLHLEGDGWGIGFGGYALDEPRKTAIMLRNASNSTLRDQPLNAGVTADMDAASATGRLRKEARESGVRFWLGLCQVLMANAIERQIDRTEAARRLEEMLVLGLTGLGLSTEDAAAYASSSAGLLLTRA